MLNCNLSLLVLLISNMDYLVIFGHFNWLSEFTKTTCCFQAHFLYIQHIYFNFVCNFIAVFFLQTLINNLNLLIITLLCYYISLFIILISNYSSLDFFKRYLLALIRGWSMGFLELRARRIWWYNFNFVWCDRSTKRPLL